MSGIPLKYNIRAIAGTPMRRGYNRTRFAFLNRARTSARNSQQQVLRHLLQLNADTDFSRDFGLRPDMSLADFRRAVPVSDYELFRPYIERMQQGEHRALLGAGNPLLMYAVTSGTTGEPKLIPITQEFLRLYRRGWQIWAVGAYELHRPLQRLNILQITSSHRRFITPDGTPCGNISGLVASMQKRIVRSMYTIPSEVATIDDCETKRYTTLRLALSDPHIGMMITANPGTLTQLFQSLDDWSEAAVRDIHNGGVSHYRLPSEIAAGLSRELRPARRRARHLDQLLEQHGRLNPADCWPHLRLLGVWTGGSVGAYLPALTDSFPGIAVRDHGLHASEGRMTLPIDDGTSSGLLEVETHFFEFFPAEQADRATPDVLEAHELQEGQDYFILLTTCSGLYRYNIRDVVRCTGWYGQTPLLEFRHKGALISSITGEKIAESQVVEAVRAAAASVSLDLVNFTLTPCWDNPPGYFLYIGVGHDEVNDRPCSRLAAEVDRALRSLNVEYDEKRASSRLRPVQVVSLTPAVWERFTTQRTQNGGGSPEQYKHPCLLPDPKFDNLFLRECGLSARQDVAENR